MRRCRPAFLRSEPSFLYACCEPCLARLTVMTEGISAMTQEAVGRWGDTLAVRLPVEIVSAAGLHDGERVEIEAHADVIISRRAAAQPTLKALFSGKTPEAWRAEYAKAYDWGPDVGRDVLEP